jgi:hypothetical protein
VEIGRLFNVVQTVLSKYTIILFFLCFVGFRFLSCYGTILAYENSICRSIVKGYKLCTGKENIIYNGVNGIKAAVITEFNKLFQVMNDSDPGIENTTDIIISVSKQHLPQLLARLGQGLGVVGLGKARESHWISEFKPTELYNSYQGSKGYGSRSNLSRF